MRPSSIVRRTDDPVRRSRHWSVWGRWASDVTSRDYFPWLFSMVEGYRERVKNSRPPGPGDCERSHAPRVAALTAAICESVSEIAAPELVGPQHAPSPASGSPRVRMEARRAGGFSRLGSERHRRGIAVGNLRLRRDHGCSGYPTAGPGPPTVNGLDKGRPSHGSGRGRAMPNLRGSQAGGQSYACLLLVLPECE